MGSATRIVPMEIGRLDSALRGLTGDPGRAVLPVPSWLIEHRDGLMLFDTGMHVGLRADATRLAKIISDTHVDFPVGEDLSARLGSAGYRPTDVTVVAISHLHFDHAGGTAEIPNARLIVQRAEWDAGHHPKLVEFGVYTPSEFDVGHDLELIEGDHDVFGDGSVVCISTPGHTKGHQSLRVQLASGPVVLTADCVYFGSMLDEMRLPVFGFDKPQQLTSMRRLASMRDDGCRLLFGHDLDQFRSLPTEGWA